MPQPSDDAVDPSVLTGLAARFGERGPAVVGGLVDTWEKEVRGRLAELAAAAAAGDATGVGRVAHAVRGGSASLGAVGLAQVCSHVERATRAGEPLDLADARRRIEQSVEQARAGLAQFRVGSAG